MITNYTELQQAVADWLNRSDLDTIIPSFITNGEARLNKRVRHREMESTAALTFDVNGEADVPSDYLEWKLLALATTPAARPEFVYPDSREFLFRFRPFSVPQYFTVIGDKVKIQPAKDVGGTFYYFAQLPALSDTTATNWLLDRSPETYLYASLVEGARFLRDEESLRANAELLNAAITELNDESRASRRSRQPAPDPAPVSQKTQEQLQ